MKANFKKIVIAITLLVLIILFCVYNIYNIKRDIKLENEQKQLLMKESKQRVANAVLTLPETTILVGLKNSIGTFNDEKTNRKGNVKLGSIFKTNYLPKVYHGRESGRIDVLASVTVEENDNKNIHIFLFEDRGDTAIQKSSVYLGHDVTISDISILPKVENNEDYQVKITYLDNTIKQSNNILNIKKSIKSVIIPVTEGHFVDKVIK